MKRLKSMLALLLICVLLCGCTSGAKNALGFHGIVDFEDMAYVRPDMDAVAQSCQDVLDAAEKAASADEILEAVWAYYEVYNDFSTNYNLAYIHYQADLNDVYWQTEHDFCAERSAQLDMYLEDIYYALAECSLRSELEEEYFGAGYFDAYQGEGMYDEELMTLLEREQMLIGQYYELSARAQEEEYYSEAYFDAYAIPMTEILTELVALRHQIALAAGYSNYPAFAWECYYYRDYTAAQAGTYLEQIRAELVPVFRQIQDLDLFAHGEEPSSEKETFAYVRTAAENMGGVTEEAFRLLDEAGLYDISASRTKSGMSFEVFLSRYYEPYVFLSATGTQYDKLSFAHEFGHFTMDYAAAGTSAGTDVLEVFSQGMEYLSLCYADEDQALTDMKLADCLYTYVEQAAYAAFELELYSLSPEELTAQNVLALYEEVCTGYGFGGLDWDPRDLITIPHFFSNPMYIISYVVSNDAALQLYQMELESSGAGKQCFEDSLDTQEVWFLAFLREAGLKSPFDRVEEVRALMESRFS